MALSTPFTNISSSSRSRAPIGLAVSLVVLAGVNGCAVLPPAVMYAAYTATGVSYITTGKGPLDHLVSEVRDENCAILRVIQNGTLCTARAVTPPAAPEPRYDPVPIGGQWALYRAD